MSSRKLRFHPWKVCGSVDGCLLRWFWFSWGKVGMIFSICTDWTKMRMLVGHGDPWWHLREKRPSHIVLRQQTENRPEVWRLCFLMLLEFILDSTSLIFMSKDNDMDLLSLKDGSRLKAYPIKQLGSWEPSISICRLSHSHWIAYFHSFMALETFTIDVDSQTLLSASQGCGHPWLLSTTKALFGHGNRSLLAQSSCPGGLRQRCLTESGQHRHGPTRSDPVRPGPTPTVEHSEHSGCFAEDLGSSNGSISEFLERFPVSAGAWCVWCAGEHFKHWFLMVSSSFFWKRYTRSHLPTSPFAGSNDA